MVSSLNEISHDNCSNVSSAGTFIVRPLFFSRMDPDEEEHTTGEENENTNTNTEQSGIWIKKIW